MKTLFFWGLLLGFSNSFPIPSFGEGEVMDLVTMEEHINDLMDNNITDVPDDFASVVDMVNWILDQAKDGPDQVDGIQCDYIPQYCARYNASAYEVYPTDENGLCPKTPNLGYDVCIDQVLESYCGYCVFIEDNNEKSYVAAEIEDEMQCKLCCNEDPEVICRGGNCQGADNNNHYGGGYPYGGGYYYTEKSTEATTTKSSTTTSITKTSTTTTASPKHPPVCKCNVKE